MKITVQNRLGTPLITLQIQQHEVPSGPDGKLLIDAPLDDYSNLLVSSDKKEICIVCPASQFSGITYNLPVNMSGDMRINLTGQGE